MRLLFRAEVGSATLPINKPLTTKAAQLKLKSGKLSLLGKATACPTVPSSCESCLLCRTQILQKQKKNCSNVLLDNLQEDLALRRPQKPPDSKRTLHLYHSSISRKRNFISFLLYRPAGPRGCISHCGAAAHGTISTAIRENNTLSAAL